MHYRIAGAPCDLKLIPEPRRAWLGSGAAACAASQDADHDADHDATEAVLLPYCDRIVEDLDGLDLPCILGSQLADDIEAASGLRWDVARGSHWKALIRLELDHSLDSGSYRVSIQSDGIVVSGGDFETVRDGVQTLRQIILQCGMALPALTIEDAPGYAVRGYYLDATRGRVPTLDWLKTWADKLCLYKYNQLQLYIEHSFMFDGLSETWRGVSPLKPADIIAFDEYCARLGIELVPSVSTFGHHYMALRTKELRGLGEFPQDADRPYSLVERQEHHTLNITKPEAFTFSTKLIDAYLELFRTKKFNICADETFDLGKGESKARADEVGVPAMYADYVSALCRHLAQRGHEALLWGDIAVEMPEILGKLPHDAMLLNWLYSPEITEEKVRLVAESGARQYVCSAVHCWNALLPHLDDAWNNISRLARYGMKYQAAGVLVTDWGDYGHVNDPRMAIIGMIYGAQCAWNPLADTDVESLNRGISITEYGDRSGEYVSQLRQATRCVAFGWEDAIHYLELDEGGNTLNRDVLASLWTDDEAVTASIRSSDGLDEARRRLLQWLAPKLEHAQDTNRDLKDAALGLAVTVSHCTMNHASIAQAIVVAIEGQRLFNDFGRLIAVQKGVIGGANSVEAAQATARGLEQWGERYCDVWRSVSAESELRHVRDIIWRCADALRDEGPETSDCAITPMH